MKNDDRIIPTANSMAIASKQECNHNLEERLRFALLQTAAVLNKKYYWREIGRKNLEELTPVQSFDRGYYNFIMGAVSVLDKQPKGFLIASLQRICEREKDYIERIYQVDVWKPAPPLLPEVEQEEAYAQGSYHAADKISQMTGDALPDISEGEESK